MDQKSFVSRWIDNYLDVGSVDPVDLNPQRIAWGLDDDALDELRMALTAILRDERAQMAHGLAMKLLGAIDRELSGKQGNQRARLKVVYGKI